MLNIFENPYLLIAIAALVFIVLTLATNMKSTYKLLIPLAIIAIGFGLDFFIQTDNEKIRTLIDNGRNAVITLNIPEISALVDNDYNDSYHKSKESVMTHCRQVFNKPIAENIKFMYLNIQKQETTAKVVFEAVIHIDSSSVYSDFGQVLPFKMEVEMTKRGKQWFVKSAEILEVNKQQVRWSSVR